MKKLFALVLVLAMALAIAVPALAATGWDKPDPGPAPTLPDFELTAAKYEYYSSTTGGYGANGVYFPDWDDSKGIVKDTLGRAYFEIEVPSLTNFGKLYPGADVTSLKYQIKLTNVKGVAACTLGAAPNYIPTLATADIAKGVYAPAAVTITLNDDANDDTIKLMYVFAAASAADVVASVTVSVGDTTLPASFLYSGTEIDVAAVAGGFTFTTDETDDHNDVMRFEVGTGDKITRLFMTPWVDGTDPEYQVLIDVNGKIAFKDGAASIQEGDTGYAALKTLYDYYMSALGFAWDGTVKYMTADLIIENLIPAYAASASVKFPAGYQSIVDPSVQPPQTGDATTVVGFVMIALALVAAAVVTVKKVRA